MLARNMWLAWSNTLTPGGKAGTVRIFVICLSLCPLIGSKSRQIAGGGTSATEWGKVKIQLGSPRK